MPETNNSPPPPSKAVIVLLAIIAAGVLALSAVGVVIYLKVRATAENIEQRVNRAGEIGRDVATRATSATRAGLSNALEMAGRTKDNVSSATRATLDDVTDKVHTTGEKISSGTASLTSKTKSILAAPGAKWEQIREARKSAKDAATTDAETSSRLQRLSGKLRSLRPGTKSEAEDIVATSSEVM